MTASRPLLPMAATEDHACVCCTPDGGSAAEQPAADAMESVYEVTGMTCSHCVASVTEEVSALPGVRAVSVDLLAGGTSRVTVASTSALDPAAVRGAVEDAGYSLAP